jgi:hypothetical protein
VDKIFVAPVMTSAALVNVTLEVPTAAELLLATRVTSAALVVATMQKAPAAELLLANRVTSAALVFASMEVASAAEILHVLQEQIVTAVPVLFPCMCKSNSVVFTLLYFFFGLADVIILTCTSTTFTATTTIYPTVTQSVTITTTNTYTQTSTATSTSTVFATVSNIKTLTVADSTVIVSKRALYTAPAWSSTQTVPKQKEQPKEGLQDSKVGNPFEFPEKGIDRQYLEQMKLVKRITTNSVTVTLTYTGDTVTQTAMFTAGASVTTNIVVTNIVTTTSTVAIGASATVHITTTSTVASSQADSSQNNPFTTTGPVPPALSTLRAFVPSTAQTDPTAACFVQPSYSACYSTPAWWSTIPADSQSYFSSVNSANNAACTACPGAGGKSNNLSTGAKAGIGVGVAVGAVGAAVLGKNSGIKFIRLKNISKHYRMALLAHQLGRPRSNLSWPTHLMGEIELYYGLRVLCLILL